MASFKNLRIENFRGFDSIELKEFNRINILMGKNNCGKSSVLEGILLLIGLHNPTLPSSINKLRGMQPGQSGFLKSMFHNMNMLAYPVVQGDYGVDSFRKLEIKPILKTSMQGGNSPLVSSPTQDLSGVELKGITKIQDNETSTSVSLTIEGGNETPIFSAVSSDVLDGTFISSHMGEGHSLTMISDLVKKKKDYIVLEAIKKFDPRVNAIKVLPDGIYLDMEGIDELVQINAAGDGIRRFLNIVSTIANLESKVVLIDEIENGLHYTAYKLLWQSILAISEVTNVQLFITTHSMETLKCLNEILREELNAKYRDWVNSYTIANTKLKGFQTYRYTYEGFTNAIENEIEIRS
ncbi:MAG: AAA family ATPase [Bacteroidales bacterium]|nr:AAA family ATPase [Bacteroidales bacterium]MDD4404329.1 AAA family ATPase [Parabacteroides sp.]